MASLALSQLHFTMDLHFEMALHFGRVPHFDPLQMAASFEIVPPLLYPRDLRLALRLVDFPLF